MVGVDLDAHAVMLAGVDAIGCRPRSNPISGDIQGLSFQDITLQASDFGFGSIVVRAPAYDAVNDRVLFMVNADGTSARYLVSYGVGEGIGWMVPVGSNDTLPQRACTSRSGPTAIRR
jgi:hypothetical protein